MTLQNLIDLNILLSPIRGITEYTYNRYRKVNCFADDITSAIVPDPDNVEVIKMFVTGMHIDICANRIVNGVSDIKSLTLKDLIELDILFSPVSAINDLVSHWQYDCGCKCSELPDKLNHNKTVLNKTVLGIRVDNFSFRILID